MWKNPAIISRRCAKEKLATVFLAAPTSTDERLKQIAQASSGFVYAVSRTGVTGLNRNCPKTPPTLVRRLRKYTKLPVAVGFGISTPEQFGAVGKFADAGVVGSAIVQTVERNPGKEAESVAQFVKKLLASSSVVSPRALVGQRAHESCLQLYGLALTGLRPEPTRGR